MKRRTVLLTGVGLLAGCSIGTEPTVRPSDRSTPKTADLIISGGPILTMDPARPRVEAVAVSDDRIVAVGTRADVLPFAMESARIVDLNGATMMPGFVDAHSHFFGRADAAGTDIEGVCEFILSLGITTTAECFVDPPLFADLERLASRKRLLVRLSAYLAANNACGESLGDWWAEYSPTRTPGELFRIGGVKIYSDGGACNTPAASYQYVTGSRGDLYLSDRELTELVQKIDSGGRQVAIHALGDRAVETTLTALEQVIGASGNVKRHRIEHSAATRPDLRARHGKIGAVVTIAGSYPTCFLTGHNNAYKFRTPDEYLEWEWPWRSLIDRSPGAHFAWHSDFPVFQPPDPVNALFGFVTRGQVGADGSACAPTSTMAANAIPVDEALRLMTTGAAYALFREDEVGRIAPGMLADFVALSADPTATEPAELHSLKVVLTMVGGTASWCRPGFEALCPSQR